MTACASLRIELFIPLRVAAQARRNSARDHFENPADRIAGAQHVVHFRFHSRFGCRIDAAQRRFEIFADGDDIFPRGGALQAHVADGDRVAQDGDAEFAQQQFAERAGGHARRRLARRGALEHVARIVKIEFLRAGQVRVARAAAPSAGAARLPRPRCPRPAAPFPSFSSRDSRCAARSARRSFFRGARRRENPPDLFRCAGARRARNPAGGDAARAR